MLKTFRGGVHPAILKDQTIDKAIRKTPLPKKVILPLLQHTGSPCQPLVSVGERVRTGQMIARSDKFISSPIHASISGTVAKIDNAPHPILGSYQAIWIEGDGRDELDPSIKERLDVRLLPIDRIRDIIREAGIVGLGGAAFPTHVKLTPPEGKRIDSVILNGAECEPYLTCDHRLMIEKTSQIIEGLKIILRLTHASRVYIGIESNKIGAAFAMEKGLRDKKYQIQNVKIVLLKTKYPQGAEKSLIKTILNREVPSGGLPFDVGCIVCNVGTALAIYQALFEGKPLYERVVTISGSGINDPANLWVRIGTPLRDLVDICGGLKKDVGKIIFGGPMMGLAQFSLDTPIIKGTSGVIFLSKDESYEGEEGVCIRCGKCIEVCPMELVPATLMHLVKKERFKEAKDRGIVECFECGACAYECPAKIPLLDYIKFGKAS